MRNQEGERNLGQDLQRDRERVLELELELDLETEQEREWVLESGLEVERGR